MMTAFFLILKMTFSEPKKTDNAFENRQRKTGGEMVGPSKDFKDFLISSDSKKSIELLKEKTGIQIGIKSVQ